MHRASIEKRGLCWGGLAVTAVGGEWKACTSSPYPVRLSRPPCWPSEQHDPTHPLGGKQHRSHCLSIWESLKDLVSTRRIWASRADVYSHWWDSELTLTLPMLEGGHRAGRIAGTTGPSASVTLRECQTYLLTISVSGPPTPTMTTW